MIALNWKQVMIAGVVAASTVFGVMGTLKVRAEGESAGSSETFTSSRYALLNAPVLVYSRSNDNEVVQDAVFKIDTMTGQIWVLQMSIVANNNPVIISANFVPVTDQAGVTQPVDPNATPAYNPNNFYGNQEAD